MNRNLITQILAGMVVVVIVSSLCQFSTAYAEKEARSAKNSVYIEGLGSGLFYSLNYERMILDDISVRVGMSFIKQSVPGESLYDDATIKIKIFPITASYLGIGNRTHSLELGVGPGIVNVKGSGSASGFSSSGSGTSVVINTLVGYRIQRPAGGFQFRIGVNGFIGPGFRRNSDDPDAWGIFPWPYLSLGGTFGR